MTQNSTVAAQSANVSSVLDREEVLHDYRIGWRSRHLSLLGRKEVLTGKAKFGIFGSGKEVPQLALAKVFEPGDFRSGYYRDQTLALATGMTTVEQFLAQLFADPDPRHEPASGGRQMVSHFGTRLLDDEGAFVDQTARRNSVADTSPTASQMPRLVGLAQASRLYRELEGLPASAERFSRGGREIAFGTIGNASCAEGMFWESVNAIGVLGVPAVISIWDDGYGISVPNAYQIAKGDLSEVLRGFGRRDGQGPGFNLYTVNGYDYTGLCAAYREAAEQARESHVPALLHITALTQPQGHSTSGSHERYKSAARIHWERESDCLRHMRRFILAQELAEEATLDAIEREELDHVTEAHQRAWRRARDPLLQERTTTVELIRSVAPGSGRQQEIETLAEGLEKQPSVYRRHLVAAMHECLLALHQDGTLNPETHDARRQLVHYRDQLDETHRNHYAAHLHSQSKEAALEVPAIAPSYTDDAPTLPGFSILNKCFDAALERHPELVAFGEDVGQLGDVNQGFSGLQSKHGEARVADTGIRECTILGQAIGLAIRGLRPMAEIQYLDYLLYALQLVSDDLATLRYRSFGGQKAPVIIRTRGHRLEGIWHSGSPMAGILGLVRGVYLCVPRDMTRAAGFYNTLLRSDDSAIVVEVLNGYRNREPLPDNLESMTLPLGVPEVLRAGEDVTLVTYGACCRIARDAADKLAKVGIDVEIIDVQTLLPFDLVGGIGESLRKTNRVIFLDEDVPGGATAYMLQQVLEKQEGFHWLDSAPRTVTATSYRPPYGSDGDYWSKPNVEDVFTAVYELMHEVEPHRFPLFYR